MHEINKVLSAAGRRLALTNFIKGLVYVGAAIVAGLILARLVERAFALGLALVIGWMAVPKMDLFGLKTRKLAQKDRDAQVTLMKAAQLDIEKLKEDMSEKLGLEKDKLEAPKAEKPEPRTPEELKRA